MNAKRVMVVDDHAIVRHGLALLLGQEPDLQVVGGVAGVAEARELLRRTAVDLAIVDLSLDGESSGLRLVRELVERDPAMRVIVLTMHDESLYWDRAMAAGAHGFVMKHSATSELIDAVRQVLGGAIYASAAAHERLLRLSRSGARAPAVSPLHSLSNRELEVLRLIGKGSGSSEIAAQLERSVKTVETHKANLKLKLGLESGGELIRYAAQFAADGGDPGFGL